MTLDYYRFGTVADRDAPGGCLLIGLLEKLGTKCSSIPEALVLAEARIRSGRQAYCCQGNPCEILVYVIEGAMQISVADESVRLIAHSAVCIPAYTSYRLSTHESMGMTGLLIRSRGSDPGLRANFIVFACCAETLSMRGEPLHLPLSSLEILRRIGRLECDGSMPLIIKCRANFHRDGIIATLLLQYAADPQALRAFIWICNAHPGASWWLDRKQAARLIEEGVAKMLG
jgi:hypothetical protein